MTDIKESLAAPMTRLAIAFGTALNEDDRDKMHDIAEQAKPLGGIKFAGFLSSSTVIDRDMKAFLLCLANDAELISTYLPVMLDNTAEEMRTQGKAFTRDLWLSLSNVFNSYTDNYSQLGWRVTHRLDDYFHELNVDYEKMTFLQGQEKTKNLFSRSDEWLKPGASEKGLSPQ